MNIEEDSNEIRIRLTDRRLMYTKILGYIFCLIAFISLTLSGYIYRITYASDILLLGLLFFCMFMIRGVKMISRGKLGGFFK